MALQEAFNLRVHPRLIDGEVALRFNPLLANGYTGSGKGKNVQVAASSPVNRQMIPFLPGYFVQATIWRVGTLEERGLHDALLKGLDKNALETATIDQTAIKAAHPRAIPGILQLLKNNGVEGREVLEEQAAKIMAAIQQAGAAGATA